MCKIGINIKTELIDGGVITSANGQYALINTEDWVDFVIDINFPQTPDINIVGNYKLKIRIIDNFGTISEWSNITNFKVSGDCNATNLISPFNIVGNNVASCTSGMSGKIIINMAPVKITNNTTYLNGSGSGASINIDGILLEANKSIILKINKGYPFSSGQVDCFNGSGISILKAKKII